VLRQKEVNQKIVFLILRSELGTRNSRLLSVSIASTFSIGGWTLPTLLPFFFAKRRVCGKHYTGFSHPEKMWCEQCAELLDI
jgi:hypothetical protein